MQFFKSVRQWKPASLAVLLLSLMLAGGCASPPSNSLAVSLGAPDRPDADIARDAARKPVAVLEFVGIKAGMSVLDALAGGGWYSEVLARAVGPEGKVIAHNTKRSEARSGTAMQERVQRLGNIRVLIANVDELELRNEVDAAMTALNLHDLANRSRDTGLVYLKAIFVALKPGGVLGLIDHVGEAGYDNRRLHRIERSTARALIEEAGFIIEAESDMLFNPADDHSLSIRDASLQRNTDRMLFRARKPG